MQKIYIIKVQFFRNLITFHLTVSNCRPLKIVKVKLQRKQNCNSRRCETIGWKIIRFFEKTIKWWYKSPTKYGNDIDIRSRVTSSYWMKTNGGQK